MKEEICNAKSLLLFIKFLKNPGIIQFRETSGENDIPEHYKQYLDKIIFLDLDLVECIQLILI